MWGYFRVTPFFSIVKNVSPDGFFGIQILPNSITAGGAYDAPPLVGWGGTPSPAPLDSFGLYRWAKFGWNLCCYGCFVLSLFNNTHNAPQNRYMKTWRHPQNRKYITYLNASRGEPSQGHMQHAQKIGEVRPCGFRVMQTDRQTNGQVNRHAHHNTSQPYGST